MTAGRILVTGATGYIGGRLVHALEDAGFAVRAMARRPAYLPVGPRTEKVAGDMLQPETLPPALEGVETAFYLEHSMGSRGSFEEEDRTAARNFGEAARVAGVRKIVYLGGLGDPTATLSPHLKSRQETGDALRASGVPVIELRASIILGSGSLSFELIRSLVERLPIMICPTWVRVQAQPIAIDDVIAYLLGTLRLPGESRIFEIGGADRMSYGDIMLEYARARGLKRRLVFVPVLTPWLSSLWLGLTTPVYARVGRKLIESIRHPTVVTDDAARQTFDLRPMGVREAIDRAMRFEEHEFVRTRWSDAVSSASAHPAWGGVKFGSRLVDTRTVFVPVDRTRAFAPIRSIGGGRGWYYANALWRIRGFLDLLVGGVGLRRGRRDPEQLRVGDALDFWRVEAYESDRRLRLAAEMRVPGRAWLEMSAEADGDGSRYLQRAVYFPKGLAGRLYWWSIVPIHGIVFAGMANRITAEAEASRTGEPAPQPPLEPQPEPPGTRKM
jgi:uncharacterized protein YbjT (DUF2867 family)